MNKKIQLTLVYILSFVTLGFGQITLPTPPTIDTLEAHSQRQRPVESDSDIGYGKFWVDAPGVTLTILGHIIDNVVSGELGTMIEGDNVNLNILFPQHRSVGEPKAETRPRKSYEVLEGTVLDDGCQIAASDFPLFHYTHDMDFRVLPDQKYDYLLARRKYFENVYPTTMSTQCRALSNELLNEQAKLETAMRLNKPEELVSKLEQRIEILQNSMTTNNCPTITRRERYDNFQKNIAVEWETGLGQDRNESNPAVAFNKVGNSYGFYSEGHQRRDVIWNWVTPGDKVYVEGIWIWDRGHPPVKTEIHPPHFIAIKRHLPVSFKTEQNTTKINNELTDDYIGTLVDIFGSADGTTMWNTKGHTTFAQVVDMKRKDYTFTATNLFAKPSPSATLAWKVIKRKGDSFSPDLLISKTSDNSVKITVPWKTRNIANTVKLAKSVVLYWDYPQTKGVLSTEMPRLYKVSLDKIHIINNAENPLTPGDGVFFANFGNNWLMLNEFATDSANVLDNGLGKIDDNADYPINKGLSSLNIFVRKGDHFRVSSNAWENDHMNNRMGILHNQYDRNQSKVGSLLSPIATLEGLLTGSGDEDMGNTVRKHASNNTGGSYTDTSTKGNYQIKYSVTPLN